MSHAATLDPHAAAPAEAVHYRRMAKFGMVMFLASEAMLFAGLIGGYIVLRLGQGDLWGPAEAAQKFEFAWPLTKMNWIMSFNTCVLVASSFVYHLAEVAVQKGRSATPWLFITVLMGSFFLGVQAWEWHHLKEEGLWFGHEGFTGYGSSFFIMTGFHGLHVLIGVLMIVWTLFRSVVGRITKEDHLLLENAGLYWHFVDVVWVLLFSLLYFDLAPKFAFIIKKLLFFV